MRIFLIILCLSHFVLISSCRDEVKQKNKVEVKKQPTIKESIPKDIFELLSESLEEDGMIVNKELGGLFQIAKVTTLPDPKSNKNIYVAFLLDKKVSDKNIQGFKLQLDMFPYDEDLELLREDTKERGRKYDSWYFVPKIRHINGMTYFYKLIDTPISDFKQVYVHLYNVKNKEKLKEPIVIRKLELN